MNHPVNSYNHVSDNYVRPDGMPYGLAAFEFPTMEQLKAWYHSPEYQELIELRHALAGCDHCLRGQRLVTISKLTCPANLHSNMA